MRDLCLHFSFVITFQMWLNLLAKKREIWIIQRRKYLFIQIIPNSWAICVKSHLLPKYPRIWARNSSIGHGIWESHGTKFKGNTVCLQSMLHVWLISLQYSHHYEIIIESDRNGGPTQLKVDIELHEVRSVIIRFYPVKFPVSILMWFWFVNHMWKQFGKTISAFSPISLWNVAQRGRKGTFLVIQGLGDQIQSVTTLQLLAFQQLHFMLLQTVFLKNCCNETFPVLCKFTEHPCYCQDLHLALSRGVNQWTTECFRTRSYCNDKLLLQLRG